MGGGGAFWERIRHFSKLFTNLEYIQIDDLKNIVTDVQSHRKKCTKRMVIVKTIDMKTTNRDIVLSPRGILSISLSPQLDYLHKLFSGGPTL